MAPSFLATITCLFLALTYFSPVYSQSLTAVSVLAKLPSEASYVASVYDGDDAIYLFGGWHNTELDQISKYTISLDTIQVVGTLPRPAMQAKAALGPDGQIYVFAEYTTVYRFNPATNNITEVAQLPIVGAWWEGFVQLNSDTVLIMAEASGSIYPGRTVVLKFNLTSLNTTMLDDLSPMTWVNAINLDSNTVYIFGDTHPAPSQPILLSYQPSNESTQVVIEGSLPAMRYQAAAVSDGKNIYLVAGYPKGVPDNGLTIFDPATSTATHREVVNLPLGNFHSTSAVYVERLNRIYVFGGYAYREFDTIWYISLANV